MPMGRLSVVDEIFLRTHRGLGTPIALQGLWRTADHPDPALLHQVHTALRTGPLGRRVIRSRIPGARRSWQPTVNAYPLDIADRPIPAADLLDWADHQGTDLDPEYGPGWRLSAVALDDGGSVVSLTCSHALADGRALVLTVDEALHRIPAANPLALGRDPSALAARAGSRIKPGMTEAEAGETEKTPITEEPPPRDTSRGSVGSNSTPVLTNSAELNPRPSPDTDWSDAFRQWSIVVGGTIRALRRGAPERPAPSTYRQAVGSTATHSAILRCPVPEWDRIAAAQDGTANSLFILLVAKMLWASGFPEDTIAASLPVDTRDEPRIDNNLAMTEIAVTRADNPATLRGKARNAYERRMSGPPGMPEEILQVIPDRWAYALSKGAGERDILCSNIGALPGSLETLGPHRCTGVAARAIHPALAPEHLPRTRLSAYLSRIGDTYTLALVSLDPAAIPSATALHNLARATAAPLGLPLGPW